MIEVEIKIPVSDRQCIDQKLLCCGFSKGELVYESDTYFNSDSFDLRSQDMALRVRSCENCTTGEKTSFLTYKGPKLDNRSMTRKELETGVEDGGIGILIIRALGFYSLPEVRKLRQYYHRDCITACLDQVDGLGDFLELEIILEEESGREAALEKLERILDDTGLDKKKMTRTSYLSMLCRK